MAKAKPDNLSQERRPRLLTLGLRLMATKTAFLRSYRRVLNTEHWDGVAVKWIIDTTTKYYDENGVAPGMQALLLILEGDVNLSDTEREIVEGDLDELNFKPTKKEVLQATKDFGDLVRRRMIRYTNAESYRLNEDGNPDEAEELLQNLLDKTRTVVGPLPHINLLRDIELYYDLFNDQHIDEISIATGVSNFDNLIGGGLRPGELGVVVAALGAGKSMWLVQVGAKALEQNRVVVHFSFENSEAETFGRYVGHLLKVDQKELRKQGRKAEVKSRLDLARLQAESEYGNIFIFKLIGSATTTRDLHAIVQQVEDEYQVDVGMIVVDYGDLMRPTRPSQSRYEDQTMIFEELRDLAAMHDCPLWTASQANREGLKAKSVQVYHIAESLGKAMKADVMVSISRLTKTREGRLITEDDMGEEEDEKFVDDHMELRIIKLRRDGSDDWRIPVRTNFAQSLFYEDTPEEIEDQDDKSSWSQAQQTKEKKRARRSQETEADES